MIECAGRTLAYRSKVFRSATLIERKPSPTGVSSGPLRASFVRLIESSVASGMGSPKRATPAIPASCVSHSICAPAAASNRTVALAIDGPMPSPGISVTCVDIRWAERDRSSALLRRNHVGETRGDTRRDLWSKRRCGIARHLADPAHVRSPRVEQDESKDAASARGASLLQAQLDGREQQSDVIMERDHRANL